MGLSGAASLLPVLIGTGAVVAGTVMQANAQKKQGKQQQKWHEYNAAIAESKAKSEERSALMESGQKREEGRRLAARQSALYAKAGVSGISPIVVMQNSAIAVETDARMQAQAGVEASQFYQSDAAAQRLQGKQAKAAGKRAFATTLLTGIGGAVLSYSAFKAAKPPVA